MNGDKMVGAESSLWIWRQSIQRY